jgi:hypothetical protein
MSWPMTHSGRLEESLIASGRGIHSTFVISFEVSPARRAPAAPVRLVLSVNLSQHPDQHRPQRPVLLAVDQEFAVCPSPER